MAFKKGRSKTGGRKPNTPNRVTLELRGKINAFLSDKWSSIEKDFDKLPAKDKFYFYEKLLQFALPRLESVAIHELGLEMLSDAQLDELLIKLKKQNGTAQTEN